MTEHAVLSVESLTPFVTQHNGDGELQRWPRPIWHPTRCGYCGKRVGIDDFLVIYSDLEARVTYPGEDARAVLEHRACGPDVGYNVELKRLLRDGLDTPRGWRTHLLGKGWYHSGISHALEAALALAQGFGEATSEAPVETQVAPSPPIARPSAPRMADPTRNPRSISPGMRAFVMERDGFRCRRCGAKPGDDVRLVVDHIQPVSKGGTADEKNLQTLCATCNSGKSDRNPHAHDFGITEI